MSADRFHKKPANIFYVQVGDSWDSQEAYSDNSDEVAASSKPINLHRRH